MISWAVKLREMRPLSVTIRKWREMTTAVFAKIGEHWKQKNLPDHFTPDAEVRYGYQPRSVAYAIGKRDRFKNGKGNPDARRLGPIALVFSGRMFREVTRNASVRAFPSRVTIRLTGPHYISGTRGTGINVDKRMRWNAKRQKMVMTNTRPNMGKELLSDTPAQRLEMAVMIDEGLTAAINGAPLQRLTGRASKRASQAILSATETTEQDL
jgi:hypothetical protein